MRLFPVSLFLSRVLHLFSLYAIAVWTFSELVPINYIDYIQWNLPYDVLLLFYLNF